MLRNNILAAGVQSSLNWYKAQVENVDLQDNLRQYMRLEW